MGCSWGFVLGFNSAVRREGVLQDMEFGGEGTGGNGFVRVIGERFLKAHFLDMSL